MPTDIWLHPEQVTMVTKHSPIDEFLCLLSEGDEVLVSVLSFKQVKGSGRRDEVSDADFHGYTEMDYRVMAEDGGSVWLNIDDERIVEQEILRRLAA